MEERDQEFETIEEQEQHSGPGGVEAPDEPVVAEEGEGEAVDEVSALLEELEEAKRKEAEYLDGWQRARAELANARKRFQREQEQAYTNAKAEVLVRMLPVVDDLERAFATLSQELDEDEQAWLGGIRLIWRKLQTLLEREGVAPIEAVGQEFDPYLHQAVTHEPSDAVPEGRVIEEMQRGYQMDGRVLRPSVVRVSSGPPAEVAAEEDGDGAQTVEGSVASEADSRAEADDPGGPGPDDGPRQAAR